IGDNVPERPAIVDCRLSAVRTPMALQFCATILAVRQRFILIFPSTKPSPAGSSLDGGNCCVAENNFCQLIGHMTASLQKHFVGVYEHQRGPCSIRVRVKLCIDLRNRLMTRSRSVALQLFRTKSPDHLIAEAEAPDRQMKRTLGPLALTCLGIGAVIGAGIFSLTGTAAAGQTFASGFETPVINFIQAWFSGTGVVLGRAGA